MHMTQLLVNMLHMSASQSYEAAGALHHLCVISSSSDAMDTASAVMLLPYTACLLLVATLMQEQHAKHEITARERH
jgi:hypothetical protein